MLFCFVPVFSVESLENLWGHTASQAEPLPRPSAVVDDMYATPPFKKRQVLSPSTTAELGGSQTTLDYEACLAYMYIYI